MSEEKEKPMILHTSDEGKTYGRAELLKWRAELLKLSKDELIDLITILNIRLQVAQEKNKELIREIKKSEVIARETTNNDLLL